MPNPNLDKLLEKLAGPGGSPDPFADTFFQKINDLSLELERSLNANNWQEATENLVKIGRKAGDIHLEIVDFHSLDSLSQKVLKKILDSVVSIVQRYPAFNADQPTSKLRTLAMKRIEDYIKDLNPRQPTP